MDRGFERSIEHYLIEEGVDKRIAELAEEAVNIIHYRKMPMRCSEIFIEIYQKFMDIYDTPLSISALNSDVSCCLRVLEEQGYIEFKKGVYKLTDKSKKIGRKISQIS